MKAKLTELLARLYIPPSLLAIVFVGFVVLALRARGGNLRRWLYLGLGTSFGIGFLVLVRIAMQLPVTRGSRVIIKHEILRGTALVTGVVYLLFVLGALLPLLLDLLERKGFARFVGARHVRATKSGFLTAISILSICGVAVSSCALGSVVSIMGGFGADLKRKILANNAHVVVDSASPSGFTNWESVLENVKKTPGVVAATPVITSEVMASVGSSMAGVLLRGVDVATVGSVIDLPKHVELGKLEWLDQPDLIANLPWSERKGVEADEDWNEANNNESVSLPAPLPTPASSATTSKADVFPTRHEAADPEVEKLAQPLPLPERASMPCILVGRELAKTLHLRLGSEVSLVSRVGELTPAGVVPRERKFRVAGIFFTGMYEYDVSHAYITLDAARSFLDLPDKMGAIQARVAFAEMADQVTPQVALAIGRSDELRVRDWQSINKSLFGALKLERVATSIVLSLAIIVASFCILCTLLLMVTEKGKEIAILKALGASDGAIVRIFMLEGIIIGGTGTIFGVAAGYAVVYGLSYFGVRIPPEVYYIDRLPIAVNNWDFFAVTVAALVICALSTVYPAWAASTLRPVEGLRYE